MIKRERSGRPQRAPNDHHPDIGPTQIRRLRDAALRGLRDPEWGTELGRLYLEEKLDPLQYAAGKRWRFVAQKYQHAIGIFPVRSAALERGSPETVADPRSEEGKRQARRETEAIEQFFHAHAVLTSSGAESIVRGLCEMDQPLAGLTELKQAQKGLSVLAAFWKIDR